MPADGVTAGGTPDARRGRSRDARLRPARRLLTRAWIDPRRAEQDLDFVGDFAFDIADTVARFGRVLARTLDDGIVIDPVPVVARGIWLDTQFPGVHLDIAIGIERADQRLGIDIGFGDPLVPPAVTWPSGARVVRPETQLAWKLHGLVEMADQWRPKDLADAWLIATRVPLDAAVLHAAIAAAFESRVSRCRPRCSTRSMSTSPRAYGGRTCAGSGSRTSSPTCARRSRRLC